jgi:probable addiction module antidote protein
MSKRRERPKTTRWNMAENIKTEKDVIAYIDAALEDGDPALIAAVLGNIARSKGMAKIAKKTGLSRESLYKSLSRKGNPELLTVLKVVNALGLKLKIAA